MMWSAIIVGGIIGVAWSWLIRKHPTDALRIEVRSHWLIVHLDDQWDDIALGPFLDLRLALCESRLRRRIRRVEREQEQVKRFDG